MTDSVTRAALVTGGASGIGLATARAFAAQGTSVLLVDVAPDGDAVANEIAAKTGARAGFVRADVRHAEEVRAAVQRALDAFGRLDYAANCAGITGPTAPTAELSEDDWAAVIGINLTGVWLCMREEIPAILQNGGGAIVNIASMSGLRGDRRTAAYTASKHGVVGLTKSAALDYARSGLRINAVCPGPTATPMFARFTGGNEKLAARLTSGTPMGRAGRPEEIAAMVLWLCSDAASYVTAQAIAVDGGSG